MQPSKSSQELFGLLKAIQMIINDAVSASAYTNIIEI